GNSTLTASDVVLVSSNYSKSHSATLTAPDIKLSQTATTDPYAAVNFSVPGTCDFTSYSPAGTVTLSPGVYCNGLNVQGGANITLNPGIYYIVGGVFSAASGATITGTGVTLVLTGNTLGQTTYATMNFTGGATLNLTAPSSGAMKGLAVFQDRNAPQYVMGATNNYNTMTGGSTQKISG